MKCITTRRLAVLAAGTLSAGMAHGATFVVNTTDDTVDANPGDGTCADAAGDCSLRAAVQESNGLAGIDTISLLPRSYDLTIVGAGEDASATGDLDITDAVGIQGRGSVITAGGLDRVFDVFGVAADISNVDLLGGAPPMGESGGAIRSTGTLNVVNAAISQNSVTGAGASGGAIFNDGGTLSARNVNMRFNSSARAGGAIESLDGTTTIENCLLEGNFTGPSPGNGGGFHQTGMGTVNVLRSTIRNNTASLEGGGLWISANGTMTVRDSSLADNLANGDAADEGGGALFSDGGDLTVLGSSITGNSALGTAGSGGGILSLGELEVRHSWLLDNASTRAGGGIELVGVASTLIGVTLSGNTTGGAPGNGGGMHISGNGSADIRASFVTGNTAASEGGGLWNSVGTMIVTGTDVRDNTANGEDADTGGGGLFNQGGTLTVRNSRIDGNSATEGSGSGGGVFNNGGTLLLVKTQITNNLSARAGGGVEANVGDTELRNVSLLGNITGAAPGNGGGLHLTGAGNVTISRSGVANNAAANEGGGLWNSATGTMTVTTTEIVDNTSPTGPNAFNDGGTFTINGNAVAPGAPGL